MIAIGGHERHTNDCSTLNAYAGSIMDITLPPDFKEFLELLNQLINREHLKQNKRASGRPKDLVDLEYLP